MIDAPPPEPTVDTTAAVELEADAATVARAQVLLDALDTGCSEDELRADVKALLELPQVDADAILDVDLT